jgi:hypothetical protein
MSDLSLLRRLLPWLALSLVLLSCAVLQPNKGEEVKATATPQPGKIVFKDDFSNPASGWNQVSAPNGATDYADGMYRIWVNQSNLDVWAKPGLDVSDVRIEVDALKVAGERNNRFGVICRLSGATNFYVFLISSDGYYGIGKVINGQFWLISDKRLEASKLIHTGSASNHLRAECAGSTLTLYVNDEKLAEVQDDELHSGDVGLFAGSYDAPGIDIRFDNFVARILILGEP